MTEQAALKNEAVVEISSDELPLSCPRPGDEIWNMHPRVFLPIGNSDTVECPYCGARYKLQD